MATALTSRARPDVRVSVIIVGFGADTGLEECLEAVTGQLAPDDEVVLVDNGLAVVPVVNRVRVERSPANVGFAGGCHVGVGSSSGDVLVFVNPDAVLQPGAVSALVARLADPAVGLAGGLVVLADRPGTVNSIGLPVHLSGLSWSEGYGEPASRHAQARGITSVSGALFGCRREVWDRLGGMDPAYFMYHEDTDLSLRCHLAGLEVVYCPDSVAEHSYDFARNSTKMFFLERNRLLTVVGDYPSHLLVRVLPVMALLEPLYFVIAVRDGWAREKLRAWGWLIRHADTVFRRRRRVQAAVTAPEALDALLTPVITQAQVTQPVAMATLNRVLALYWRAARPRNAPVTR